MGNINRVVEQQQTRARANSQAVEWWKEALGRYLTLHNSMKAEGVHSLGIPEIDEGQIQRFGASLYQQLERTITPIGHRQPIILFVNSAAICEELKQAAQAADIDALHRVLPEQTVMRIYPDEVVVTQGDLTSKEDLMIWLVEIKEAEGTGTKGNGPQGKAKATKEVMALQKLAAFLGLSQSLLHQMAEEKRLEVFQENGVIRFRCEGIEGAVGNDTTCGLARDNQ